MVINLLITDIILFAVVFIAIRLITSTYLGNKWWNNTPIYPTILAYTFVTVSVLIPVLALAALWTLNV